MQVLSPLHQNPALLAIKIRQIKVNLLLNFETRTAEYKVGTKLMVSCLKGTVVAVQLLTLYRCSLCLCHKTWCK